MSKVLGLAPVSTIGINKSKGSILYTDYGKELVDLQSGIWCTNIGHQNDVMLKAIGDTMSNLIHLHGGFIHSSIDDLITRLGLIMDIKDSRGVFLSSGSEAVLLGLKLCKIAGKGRKLLTFNNAYLNAYSHDFNSEWVTIDYNKCMDCTSECSHNCSVLDKIDFSSIGSFILESVNGRLSIKPPEKLISLILSSLRDDAILMANEVTNGFGRTGKWFGYMHYKSFKPDIVSLGKALGNGYPISGLITSERIGDMVDSEGLVYVQSHQNDPLGCHIGLAIIDYIDANKLVQKSATDGNRFIKELKASNIDFIESINGSGFLITVVIKDNLGRRVADILLDRGFFIGSYGNILHIAPPLNLEYKHLSKLIDALLEIQALL